MSILVQNIQCLGGAYQAGTAPKVLRGEAMAHFPVLENAWLLCEGGKVKSFGLMSDASRPTTAEQVIDATGRCVLPAWVDSHTHLIFAGSREKEFVDKINGLGYEEIARRGGGILNSAARLANASEESLLESAYGRLLEIRKQGTGALEIKSGYGLATEQELKMLRVARKLKGLVPGMDIKTSFLGAHTLPMAYRENREGYIQLLINEMLPQVAGEGLADYMDVFCEKVAFTASELDQLLEAGNKHGLKPKVHVNQFNALGGVGIAVKHGAISVDHLEVMADEDFEILRKADTIATLLPSAPFFINDPNQPPARRMMQEGLAVALASDFNPGSSPSGRMSFVLTLACVRLRMTPAEAFNAATINGAAALELGDTLGTLEPGRKANFIITRPIPSLEFIPYSFGSELVEMTCVNGVF